MLVIRLGTSTACFREPAIGRFGKIHLGQLHSLQRLAGTLLFMPATTVLLQTFPNSQGLACTLYALQICGTKSVSTSEAGGTHEHLG